MIAERLECQTFNSKQSQHGQPANQGKPCSTGGFLNPDCWACTSSQSTASASLFAIGMAVPASDTTSR
eukprot:scaffold74504_cov17-Tisochrysis_lutea.AAC.1